eukprot:7258450-Lingulodinium_polyedra.AAC.1
MVGGGGEMVVAWRLPGCSLAAGWWLGGGQRKANAGAILAQCCLNAQQLRTTCDVVGHCLEHAWNT